MSDIENIEVRLFIEALKLFSGYDLSGYAQASLTRRIRNYISTNGYSSISELMPVLAHQPESRRQILNQLTVNVSELFRDPFAFLALKNVVLPDMANYQKINIWVAGCATGEEAYSLAIMLDEANLIERSHIYATDINSKVIQQCETGILRKSLNRDDAKRYQQAGGSSSLSQYFSTAYGQQKFKHRLMECIHFCQHDLIQDKCLKSIHLAMCRNVMIYFNPTLQSKVLQSLFNSLVKNGFLMLGTKEGLEGSNLQESLKVANASAKIYQRN